MSAPVLDGELSIRCAGQFPPRARHRFWTGAGAAPRLLIAARCGIEGYFHQINIASTTDDQHHRIGERYGIRVSPR